VLEFSSNWEGLVRAWARRGKLPSGSGKQGGECNPIHHRMVGYFMVHSDGCYDRGSWVLQKRRSGDVLHTIIAGEGILERGKRLS